MITLLVLALLSQTVHDRGQGTQTSTTDRIVWLWKGELDGLNEKLKKGKAKLIETEKFWIRAQATAGQLKLSRDQCQEGAIDDQAEIGRLKKARIDDIKNAPTATSSGSVPWAIGAGLVLGGVAVGIIVGVTVVDNARPP